MNDTKAKKAPSLTEEDHEASRVRREAMALSHSGLYRRHNPSRIGSRARALRPISVTKEDVSRLVQGHNETFVLYAGIERRINTMLGIVPACANEPDPNGLLTVRPKSGLDAGARATFRDLQRGAESRAMIDEREAIERKEAEAALQEAQGRKLLSESLGRRLTSAENELIDQVKVRIQKKDLVAYREALAKARREAVQPRTSLVE